MRLRMRHYKLNGKSDRHREVAVFLRLSLMGSLTFVQPLRHCCAMPPLLVGEALAYRKASPLRQRLPYKGSWREAPERLYEGKPDREPLAGLPSPSLLRNDTSPKGRGFGRPGHFLLDTGSLI